jgi:hypothetical protein
MTVPTVTMMDAIGASSHNIPVNVARVGAYVTGTGDVPWSTLEKNRFTSKQLVTIDQLPADPGDTNAMVCDCEYGAATIKDAVDWCKARIAMKKRPTVYIQASNLTSLVNALVAANIKSADIWLANWNLNLVQATDMVVKSGGPFPIVAVQWASPSSNPNTIVPGTGMTLKTANIDLSVAVANWPELPTPIQYGYLVENWPLVIPVTSADGGTTWKK